LDPIIQNLDRIHFTPELIQIIRYECNSAGRLYDRKRQSISNHFRALMNKLGMKSLKVPCLKLRPEDIDGWPQNIEIKKPRLYKKEELYQLIDNLDQIRPI
jgi:hypothetical protein